MPETIYYDTYEDAIRACVAREQGVHTLMNYEAQDAGYSCPLPITPEDRQAELQRQFIDAIGVLDTIQKQLISGTTRRAR